MKTLLALTFCLLAACATPKVGPAPNLAPVRQAHEVAHKHIQETRHDIDSGQVGLEAVDKDLQELLKE